MLNRRTTEHITLRPPTSATTDLSLWIHNSIRVLTAKALFKKKTKSIQRY